MVVKMNDNEKLAHSSDDKNKFSIESILAEYSRPKAQDTPKPTTNEQKQTIEEILDVAQDNTPAQEESEIAINDAVEENGDLDIEKSNTVEELFDVIDEITGEADSFDVDEDDDVKVYTKEDKNFIEEPVSFTIEGEPLPENVADETEENNSVDLTQMFEGGVDDFGNAVGFDSFEGNANTENGVTPEAQAFNDAKNGTPIGDSRLNTLFSNDTEKDIRGNRGDSEKKKKRPRKRANEILHRDEVDFSSEQGINRSLDFLFKKSRFALLSVFGTAIFFVISLALNLSASFAPISDYLKPGAYTTVFALIDLQIMLFAAMCVVGKLIDGAVDLYDHFGSLEGVSLVMTLIISAFSVYTAVARAGQAEDVYSFGTVGCLCLLMLALHEYYKSSSDYLSFRIAASPASKYGSVEIDVASDDCTPFESYMTAGSKAVSIQKGEKYVNFTQRNEAMPKCEASFGVGCAVSFIVSALIGLAVYFISDEKNVYLSITAALILFCSSVSLNTFIVSSLPRYLLSKKASKHNCAIVGQNVYEEYENVSVISFEDTEVFPPKDVRVSSIRVYGSMALDKAILDIAFISKKLGGPLSDVFAKAVTYNPGDLDNVEILEVYPDALKAAIGQNEYLLATSAYLRANNYKCYEDTLDSSYLASLGSILYMVKNGETSAKFYIKYAINPKFENVLTKLNDADVCVAVKTVDPCINNDILISNLRNSSCRISVVKGSGIESLPSTSKNVNSGIISITGIHNFLKMFVLCEILGRTVKVNTAVKTIGTVFGFLIPLGLLLTSLFGGGVADVISVLGEYFYVLLIQLFWIIPVALLSAIYK